LETRHREIQSEGLEKKLNISEGVVASVVSDDGGRTYKRDIHRENSSKHIQAATIG
jgi:aminopeptidase-like protein